MSTPCRRSWPIRLIRPPSMSSGLIRSDPFFFDLMGFCNNLRFTGIDYFLDKDVFAIVLEVQNSALGDRSKVGLWSRVLWSHDGEWFQVARLGLPPVSILFNAAGDKDRFNRSE